MADRPLHVCYFGAYREEYSRNRIMIEGLRRNGVEVVECHALLWRRIEDRVAVASGGWALAMSISAPRGTFRDRVWTGPG